jgi:hypothetical protein
MDLPVIDRLLTGQAPKVEIVLTSLIGTSDALLFAFLLSSRVAFWPPLSLDAFH